MKTKKLLALLLFIGCMALVHAQRIPIQGVVADEKTGLPVIGASVVLKGTQQGTLTDAEGKFRLNAQQGDVLVISFVGYETQEVMVGEAPIEIKLKETVTALDEIVVIGYGSVKKNDATGSVATVSSKDFNKGAITSPQELLIGKSSGVVITTPTGMPGSGATMRIRGGSSLQASNDPLIVIDGIPVDNSGIAGVANPLASLNPNDIESVTVLKDASATAIYGSRASNGVIMITTKRGKEGSPMTVNYTGNISMGIPIKYMDVLDANEFIRVLKEQVNAGKITSAVFNRVDTINPYNTDWQKEIYRNAISTDHNVNITGSLPKLPYRLSLGYTDQNGILKYSNMKRSSVNLGLNPSLLDDHLVFNIDVKGMKIDNNFSNTDAIGSAVEMDPTKPVKNGNTRYGGYFAWTELSSNDPLNGLSNNIATHNPVARLEYRDNKSTAWRGIGNFQADYKFHFLPELKATVNMAYDYYTSKGHDNTDTLASWSYRTPETNLQKYSQTNKTSLFNFYLNYNKDIEAISSNINITGGYEWQHFYREGDYARRPWKPNSSGVYVNADTTEWKNENYLVSFFGRLNYSLLDRYLLTFTLRDDGSSRFSKDTRWGLFPSVAFAWKINNESFLREIKEISEFKLRLGYGVTGQQNISGDYYPYMPTYEISEKGAYYQFGNEFYPTLRPNRYDAHIKWEETTTQNIGLDFGFFKNRITGSVDVYKRVTKDLINQIPIPVGTNFSNTLVTNVGSLENKGYEITLNVKAISTKDISWEIGSNLSYNKNKITKLTRMDDSTYTGIDVGYIAGGVGNTVQKHMVGYPAYSFFLFKQLYDDNGMPIEGAYFDKTGSGGNVAGNNANKYYLHKPAPDYLIGISSNLRYKQIDFSFSARISLGNYVYNNNASNRALYQNLYNQSGFASNILSDVFKTNFRTAQYWSDFYLEDASFFRMDNMSLGYNFNMPGKKLGGRVSFTVQNVFVITNYSGLDPEVDGGIDNNIYPRPRTYVLGLSLNF